jgi:hypothetical protein
MFSVRSVSAAAPSRLPQAERPQATPSDPKRPEAALCSLHQVTLLLNELAPLRADRQVQVGLADTVQVLHASLEAAELRNQSLAQKLSGSLEAQSIVKEAQRLAEESEAVWRQQLLEAHTERELLRSRVKELQQQKTWVEADLTAVSLRLAAEMDMAQQVRACCLRVVCAL